MRFDAFPETVPCVSFLFFVMVSIKMKRGGSGALNSIETTKGSSGFPGSGAPLVAYFRTFSEREKRAYPRCESLFRADGCHARLFWNVFVRWFHGGLLFPLLLKRNFKHSIFQKFVAFVIAHHRKKMMKTTGGFLLFPKSE